MPSQIDSEERKDAVKVYLQLMLDSGYDVIDLTDLQKRYPDVDCLKILRESGYIVEEDMVFLRYS
tara:strand:- start:18 stop:212 length:195 start_codon:yes stop_codon:yes gene_type:complete